MKRSIIDTDILSYFLKGDSDIYDKINHYIKENRNLTITEISVFEILAGLSYKKADKQIESFEDFIRKCEILKLTKKSIKQSAITYAELRRKGITIGTADLLIAGIALSTNLILVTNNTKHYQNLSNLQIENWKQ